MKSDVATIVSFIERVLVFLLAPAGIWFGWFLQRKDKSEEQSRQRNDRLRQKAEEIYAEIDAVQNASMTAVLHAFRDLHGTLEEPLGFSPEVRLDRLRALILMYFPGGAPILDAHEAAAFEPVKKHSQVFAEIETDTSNSVGEKLKRAKESKLDCAKTINTITIETAVKLRGFMNVEVKKLI